ncbi:MAG: hypothetical protein RJA07_1072 [Bacteroidota bacterium]|jgi:gliding motility-associated-like protein
MNKILSFLVFVFLFSSFHCFGQCKWQNIDTLDFENNLVVDTSIVASSSYHTTPQTYGHRTGTYGLYFNVQNTVSAGALLYHHVFDVCSGSPYQFSFYYKTYVSGILCDITIKFYDGNTLVNTTATGPISFTTWQQYVYNFTPTSTFFKVEIYTNIAGSGGGNDLAVDDMVLKNCHKYYTDNLFICSGNSNYNIFDSIPSTTINNITGTWVGPSILTNAHLGTFNPSTNTNGNYLYTYVSSSVRCISDTAVITVNTAVCGNSCSVLSLTNDTIVCKNSILHLTAKLDTGTISTITWSPSWGLSNASVWNPTTTATKDTTYHVTVLAVSPINLIANGDFSLGNASFTSGYTYCSASLPPAGCVQSWGLLSCPGFYTITTSPNLAHSNFSAFNNHTGGVGNMLVVNGSTNPSISVWCQTVTVTPNTNYNLSAWFSNVDPFSNAASLALLSFNINNVQVGATFSPVLTTGSWTNQAVTWNSGASTTATICINNNATFQGGNDFAIDDISFNTVCTLTDSVKITVNIAPTVKLPIDTFLCNAVNININPIITGKPLPTLLWQNNSSAATYHATTLGTYWLQVSNGCGTKRDTMKISSGQAPTSVDLGIHKTICNLDSFHLIPNCIAATPVTFKWQDSTIHSYYNATTNGLFYVRAYNSCGSVWDTVSLIFKKKPTIDAGLNQLLCNQNSYTINPTVTGSANIKYKWQDSSALNSFTATATKLYYVRAYNECGSAWDTVRLTFKTSPTVDLEARKNLCDSLSYKLLPTVTGSATLNYRWQDSSSLNKFIVTTSGVYFVRVFNECGSVWDTTSIQFNKSPLFSFGNDTSVCDKISYNLIPTISGTTPIQYAWSNGSFAAGITLYANHTVSLKASNFCGSHTDTFQIKFLKSPTVNFSAHLISKCYKSPVLLKPIISGSLPISFIWNNGAPDTSQYTATSGIYKITVTNQCSSDSDSITVNLIPMPTPVYLGKLFTICYDTFIKFNAHNYGCTFLWSPSLTTDSTLIANKSGIYSVQISNQSICVITDTVKLKTIDCNHGYVLMPNAFSPNGDGIDDYIFPIIVGENAHLKSFKIFNRWGEIVYNPDLYLQPQGWDGRYNDVAQPTGTYIYTIEYTDFDEPKFMKGNITLLR